MLSVSNRNELIQNGYTIIPNVLSPAEINHAKELFFKWKNGIDDIDNFHSTVDPHGIFKYHEVGHQEHAWYLRTLPQITNIFKELWNTDKLISSFDGCCYIPKSWDKKDKNWTHTDQGPGKKGVQCYQSFISLTDNKERTLVVYEKTHEIHEFYFDTIQDGKKVTGNWHLIDENFLNLDEIKSQRKALVVPAGSLVIWDSRIFHQNRYGKENSEERIVQYLCYLPANIPSNTEAMCKKRKKYFEELRTTSHWPSPIHVNNKNPRTFGNFKHMIDYDKLKKPDLTKYLPEINNLL